MRKQKGDLPLEYKTIKKRFFSSAKECKWLNVLGEQGYLLISRTENVYTFELTSRKIFYSVEWLDCAPSCEEATAYIESYRLKGVSLATTYSLWAYFTSDQPIIPDDAACKRTAVRYRNTALWLCGANLITSVLIGYHFSIIPFLESNSVVFKAPVLETSGNIILKLAYRLWYGAEKIFYYYNQACSNLFGQTKASLTLGILIPLACVLSVLCALWIREWLRNEPPKTKLEEEEMQDVCQESEISGKTENGCG